MRKLGVLTLLTAFFFAIVATSHSVNFGSDNDADTVSVRADVVATGIPGAGDEYAHVAASGDRASSAADCRRHEDSAASQSPLG